MTDEQRLIEKLLRIEALHAGAATHGEREAAAQARERIRARLARERDNDPPEEFSFSLPDPWSRRLFIALLRRYDLRPYRYPRQRRTTVMARVPRQFLDHTLWPEFEELDRTLGSYLKEVTERVIREGIAPDTSEVEVRPAQNELVFDSREPNQPI
ncbi:MAG: hypothetical protein H7A46_13150 [Verrucomicrobiales bacterium]|nr:hypothetical protein [Verrucomicrobiales bacterium]